MQQMSQLLVQTWVAVIMSEDLQTSLITPRTHHWFLCFFHLGHLLDHLKFHIPSLIKSGEHFRLKNKPYCWEEKKRKMKAMIQGVRFLTGCLDRSAQSGRAVQRRPVIGCCDSPQSSISDDVGDVRNRVSMCHSATMCTFWTLKVNKSLSKSTGH